VRKPPRNTSHLAPLTPMPPEPNHQTPTSPAQAHPDTHAEEVIFKLYLESQKWRHYWRERALKSEERHNNYVAKGKVRHVAKGLKVSRLDREARKGKL
jgi:hypothetical protein